MNMENNGLIQIISEIKKALDSNCYLAALSLSLIIPDICGQREFLDLVNKKGKKLSGQLYRKWFDEYIGNYENSPSDPDDWPRLTGEVCYALRCAVFHEGNTKVAKKYKKFTLENFELKIEKKNKFDIYVEKTGYDTRFDENGNEIVTSKIRVDVRNLCNKMIWCAEGMMKRRPELFEDLSPFNIFEHDKVLDNYMELKKLNARDEGE